MSNRVLIGTVQIDKETGHPIEQMNNPDTIESLRAERDAAYKFIRQHVGPVSSRFSGDHACAKCYPYSEILVEGFVCQYHRALSRTSEEGK